MNAAGRFDILVNPIDGTDNFSAVIDWGSGEITPIRGGFASHELAVNTALKKAAAIIDGNMRLQLRRN